MKVLIVRVGAMGDVLHALPAVTALRRALPTADIGWAVDPRWAPLLAVAGADRQYGSGPAINRVHLVETRLWKSNPFGRATLRSLAGLRRELRRARYDIAVDMQGTLRSATIARFSGAPHLFGYADPRETLAARLYRTRVIRQGRHVVAQGTNLLAAATGVSLLPSMAGLPISASAERWADCDAVLRRPLCVLTAGAGWGAKQWPAARFGDLARGLHERGFDVAVSCARPEDPVANEAVRASSGVARLLPCDIAGLTALLRRTDLFIGGDTGPTHLAAALGVPVVGLYGPTDPARNGPWGPAAVEVVRHPESGTSYRHIAEIDHGLARVTAAEVLQAVDRLNSQAV